MSDLQKRIADALYQAALEGDESPKMLLSQRVVEILLELPAPRSAVADLDHLREQIRAVTNDGGITKEALAKAAGVDKATIFRLMNNDYEHLPSTRTIGRISAAIDRLLAAGDETALRDQIKERGINQSELARRLNLHPSAVNKLVQGHRRIKVNEVAVICQMLSEVPE